ncbi:MAG: hypothetical protein AAF714_12350 [Pseudomonadota bacterium]
MFAARHVGLERLFQAIFAGLSLRFHWAFLLRLPRSFALVFVLFGHDAGLAQPSGGVQRTGRAKGPPLYLQQSLVMVYTPATALL